MPCSLVLVGEIALEALAGHYATPALPVINTNHVIVVAEADYGAAGFQPSGPPSTVSMVMFLASASVNCLVQAGRLAGLAPAPVELNSAYRAVVCDSGFFQSFQPSGRTTADISQRK